MKPNNQVVISRFAEDIDWIRTLLENEWIESVLIYNKGEHLDFDDPRVEVREVPNIGREGGTYLDHIIENYSDLPEKMWFTQAAPMEHSPDFLGLMKKESVALYEHEPFQGLSDRWKTSKPAWFNLDLDMVEETNAWRINGNRCVKYFINHNLHTVGHCELWDGGVNWMTGCFVNLHSDRHIFGYLANLTGIPEPKPITEFFYAACFFVHREAVHSNPVSSYERLRDFLYESEPQGFFQGYLIERFWPYFFTKRSHYTLTDCYRDVIKGKYVAVYDSNKKTMYVKDNKIIRVSSEKNHHVLFVNDGIKVLPGLNFQGKDLIVRKCESLEAAKKILELLERTRPQIP